MNIEVHHTGYNNLAVQQTETSNTAYATLGQHNLSLSKNKDSSLVPKGLWD